MHLLLYALFHIDILFVFSSISQRTSLWRKKIYIFMCIIRYVSQWLASNSPLLQEFLKKKVAQVCLAR